MNLLTQASSMACESYDTETNSWTLISGFKRRNAAAINIEYVIIIMWWRKSV